MRGSASSPIYAPLLPPFAGRLPGEDNFDFSIIAMNHHQRKRVLLIFRKIKPQTPKKICAKSGLSPRKSVKCPPPPPRFRVGHQNSCLGQLSHATASLQMMPKARAFYTNPEYSLTCYFQSFRPWDPRSALFWCLLATLPPTPWQSRIVHSLITIVFSRVSI